MLRHIVQTSLYRTPVVHRAIARHAPALRRTYSAQDKPHEQAVPPAASEPTSNNGNEGNALNDLSAKLDELRSVIEEKDSKISELNDRTLRVLAEMENVRTIARRDVDNAKRYGIMGFAKGLLDVADNLGLAIKAVPEEKASSEDADPMLSALHTGLKATEIELLKVFAQHGLARYGAVGDAFDPDLHQALYEAPTDSVDPGTIVDITKMGYSIGDRILRPAEVGVSKASS